MIVPRKYIFVSGGVMSSVGKGVVASSICLLLKKHGFTVTPVKCENYFNVDAGTINPIEHGDPFLCEDGLEADMDLGNYERFLNQEMGRENFITMGQVMKKVIEKERSMGYDGEDVEAIPHVCNEIIRRIKRAGEKSEADFVVIELGGTAGEYQNVLYYEASRIMDLSEDVLHIHVSYVPIPPHIGEPKTKPTQLSFRHLMSMGIQPDIIIGRSEGDLDEHRKYKLALTCNIDPKDVFSNPNTDTVFRVPLILREQNLDKRILEKLNLTWKEIDLRSWEKFVQKITQKKDKEVKISIVGKYFGTGEYSLTDSYFALIEAIKHACWKLGVEPKINFVNSDKNVNKITELIENSDGIIVPIGWGKRGVEGKIRAIKFSRENKVPYLGLCYGMQLACVEFARNVIGWKNAHTVEADSKTPYPIIHEIPLNEKYQVIKGDGTSMRLGGYGCVLKKGSLIHKIYDKHNEFKDKKKGVVSERHRHRYEFNNEFKEEFEKNGMVISGVSPDNFFVEMIELPERTHPFFIGTQGHPEYKSTPMSPHPIFLEFIKVCLGKK
ncbi:MAG: CTP synthase [Candidatus Aenigmarchaeota archaeon]|nr:CTP synthase [Candidatus Aenigmarchaeota archaeon]